MHTNQFQDHLAPCAVRGVASRGRRHREVADPLRSPFELDRHRIISCTAFRRVRSKTQVFGGSERRDHDRTRLTHSIEVAEIARLLARQLRVNETLAETIALAHDLGHPPFGHAGEAALQEMMADHGGFEHNTHALRVVDYLEHPFPAFRGLNLTYEVREGLIKHVTKFDKPRLDDGVVQVSNLPLHRLETGATLAELLASGPMPTVEAQAVALADRLAYDMHDLEDAIGAGFVDDDALETVALWQEARCGVPRAACLPVPDTGGQPASGTQAGATIHAIRRPVLDAMLGALLADAIRTSTARLGSFTNPEDVRRAADLCVTLSDQMNKRLEELESLLAQRVYSRPEIARMDTEANRIVTELFAAYLAQPDELPPRFRTRIVDQGEHRVVCDYVAGMTDRFCRAEHARTVGQVF